MKICIDAGHTLTGADTGAEGCGYKEQDKTREIANKVQGKLIALGHVVFRSDVDSCTSLNDSLQHRVDVANNNNVDLFVSIHLNAGGGAGVEVYTYNGQENAIARSILNNLVTLGYANRGIKGESLYVINHTHAPAMLVECGFIDNSNDMTLYNAENIANAIVKGITGQTVSTPTATATATITQLQTILNNLGYRDKNGNKLIVDGIAGTLTLSACPLLKFGSRGQVVQWLQLKLQVTSDGIFGIQTNNAVIYYQSHSGLSPDAVVGPNTWTKLLEL